MSATNGGNETVMVEQPEAWRVRQGRVLTELRERAGRRREDVAHEADVSYWRYVRFETGESPLPAEVLPTLAGALRVSPYQLARELGLLHRPSFRELLEGEDVPEDQIRDLLLELADARLTPAGQEVLARLVGEANGLSAKDEQRALG